jgi:hypothetical protein
MAKIKVTGLSAGGDGSVAASSRVTVRPTGGGLATIYSDQAGTSESNPFVANSSGAWQFFADPGVYDITVSKRNRVTFTQTDVVVGYIPYSARSVAYQAFSSDERVIDDLDVDTNCAYAIPFAAQGAIAEPLAGGDVIRVNTGVANSIYSLLSPDWELAPLGGVTEDTFGVKYVGVGKRVFHTQMSIGLLTATPDPPSLTAVPYIGISVVEGDDWDAGTYTPESEGMFSDYEFEFYSLYNLVILGQLEVRPGQVVIPRLGQASKFPATYNRVSSIQLIVRGS